MNKDNINIHGERSKFKQFIVNFIGLELIGVVLYGFGCRLVDFLLVLDFNSIPAMFVIVFSLIAVILEFVGALIIIFAFIPAFVSSYLR